jgi:hypothetical protein
MRKRAKYSKAIKERVRAEYPYCTTLDEKRELARSLGMDSLHKLYNLASRLGVTRTNADDDFHVGLHREPGITVSPSHALGLGSSLSETVFTDADDNYLRNHWGNTKLAMIAAQRGHSESALLYRARTLGLRRCQPQWSCSDAARYLGIEESFLLQIDTLMIFETSAEPRTRLVSATSLWDWVKDETLPHAEEFFLLELKESTEWIQSLRERWEGCKYVTPDHMCQNPAALNSYGLYCSRREEHDAGEDPKCRVRTLPLLRYRAETPSESRNDNQPKGEQEQPGLSTETKL